MSVDAVRGHYAISNRDTRANISAFASSLGQNAVPKEALPEGDMYSAIVEGYIIYWYIEDENWVVVLDIEKES
ncbi:MAG: hypothetical protein AAF639_22900 [Chloroflexota bacterium]